MVKTFGNVAAIATPPKPQPTHMVVAGLDFSNPLTIYDYGKPVKEKLSKKADYVLEMAKGKDCTAINASVMNIVNIAKGVDIDRFGKSSTLDNIPVVGKLVSMFRASKQQFLDQVQSASQQLDVATDELKKHVESINKRSEILQGMYEDGVQEIDQLNSLVVQGNAYVVQFKTEIAKLSDEQQVTQDSALGQRIRDMVMFTENFEKHLFDLQCIIQESEITNYELREQQYADQRMLSKFQSVITHAIPLWKKKIAQALQSEQQRKSLTVLKTTDEFTNDLIRNHADTVKQNTLDAAKASQQSIISTETIEYSQAQLMSTVDEVIKINNESATRREDGIRKFKALSDARNIRKF